MFSIAQQLVNLADIWTQLESRSIETMDSIFSITLLNDFGWNIQLGL